MQAKTPTLASASATSEKILDAAEALFIEKGFAATSLRAIASLAGVNLAATNYHFGSKHGLLEAVLHRRAMPLNAARLSVLDELELNGKIPSVEEIVAAFFTPLTEGLVSPSLPLLVGRLHAEPRSISEPLLTREFGTSSKRFISALSRVLPEVSLVDLGWRFHFVLGAMIQWLTFEKPMGARTQQISPRKQVEKLKAFAVAGLLQQNHPLNPGNRTSST